MAKISEYGNYDTDKSQAEVEKFQETGVLPVSGKYADNGNMTTKNVKLSDLVGSIPEIETGDAGKVLTVNANEDGTQWDTVAALPEIDAERDFQKVLTVAQGGNLEWSVVDIPTYYADEPITMTGYSFGLDYNGDNLKIANKKLDIKNPVPAPGTNEHRGEYLKVADDSDSLVWDSPAVPEISQYNGDVSVVNATNDVSSGGYVFDVNLDSDTLEKRSTQGAHQVSYIAVKNPVPPTTDATDGDVLTYDATDGIVWAPVSGGGGGGGNPFSIDEMLTWKNNMDKTVAAWLEENPADNHIDGGGLQTSVKRVDGVTKYQYSIHAGSGSFFSPWAS